LLHQVGDLFELNVIFRCPKVKELTCIKHPSIYNSTVRVGNKVDKVAVGQVSLRLLGISPVSIIPPLLHTHMSFICIQSPIILARNGVAK